MAPPLRPPADRSRPASFPRLVLGATLVVVGVAVTLYLLYRLRQPLTWLVIAAFLAMVLSGPVDRLSRRMRPGLAITLTYLVVLVVPIVLVAIVAPPFIREGVRLAAQLPTYAAEVTEWVESNETLNELDDQYGLTERLQEQVGQLTARVGDAAGALADVGFGIANSIFAAVTILILSVFLTANGRRWVGALLAFLPPERGRRLAPTVDRISVAVGAYVGGALLQATVAGVTSFVVLTLLGVPFAAPLAVVVALFDLIPMVGATIAAVLVGVITLFSDFPTDTLIWAGWSLVYQQVENTLIQPRIQSRAVGVHPFTVIVAVLFGGTLFGVLGALLAVPVAASVQIVLRDAWRWRHEPASATS